MQNLEASWNYPTQIHVSSNCSQQLPVYCQQLAMTSPLIVTDPGLASLPMTKALLMQCQAAGLKVSLFSDIKGNPNGENIEQGVLAFKRGQHDGVIAFGGGSALDAGKAIALMVGQKEPIWAFEDVDDNWTRVNTEEMAPVVAIPTTAGTGSEVGRSSVITDEDQKVKRIIFHPKMLPSMVLLDPVLSTGLPPSLTAATGLDAFSHCLEAYCAPFYHPMAEAIAMEGMRLIKEHLPVVYVDGANLHSRTQMLVASSMGATAFQRGLGAMHAIAHSLGALYDAHHGTLNAILMPYVLSANRHAIEEPITRLSGYLNLEQRDFDGFMDWLMDFRAGLSIPHSLAEIGIDGIEAIKVGGMSAQDPSAGGNPLLFTDQQYSELFKCAVAGTLPVPNLG
jgi:alcohol dehydrogenase class IV